MSGAIAAAAWTSPNPAAARTRARRFGRAAAPATSAPAAEPIASAMLNRPYVPALPWKARLRHRRQHDREVEAERSEHPDKEDRPHDVAAPAQVLRGRPQPPASRRRRRSGSKIGRSQPQQADRRADIAGSVDCKDPARAHARDEQARRSPGRSAGSTGTPRRSARSRRGAGRAARPRPRTPAGPARRRRRSARSRTRTHRRRPANGTGDRDGGQRARRRRRSAFAWPARCAASAAGRQPPPVYRPRASIGRNCSAIVTPTAVALCVRSSISQSWAMLCIQVPMLARLWPAR